MKKLALLLLLLAAPASAECLFNCALQPGTVCINNQCVPVVVTPTPTPVPIASNEIRLDLVLQSKTVVIDCAGIDFSKLRVIGKRRVPPGAAYYYSSIFYYVGEKTTEFYARKDLLNRYVFVLLWPNEKPAAQLFGVDFVFNLWENTAFREFFASKTCEELKQSGLHFRCGISFTGGMDDYESMTFTFK